MMVMTEDEEQEEEKEEVKLYALLTSTMSNLKSDQLITDFYIVFQPSSHANLNRPNSLHQTGHESRLKALVEERETLMNTGTYSLEDPIINKLDNEIKTLLANGIT